MKRILLSIALMLGIMDVWGQEIKTQQVVADDYIRLFEEMGYKACFYGSNGVGTDHSGPQYYDGIKCGTDDFNQLFYYGYPPCCDDITVNYGSSTSTCWQADIS